MFVGVFNDDVVVNDDGWFVDYLLGCEILGLCVGFLFVGDDIVCVVFFDYDLVWW